MNVGLQAPFMKRLAFKLYSRLGFFIPPFKSLFRIVSSIWFRAAICRECLQAAELHDISKKIYQQ